MIKWWQIIKKKNNKLTLPDNLRYEIHSLHADWELINVLLMLLERINENTNKNERIITNDKRVPK